MNSRNIGIMALGATALMIASVAAGLRLNFTESAPRGLWLERAVDNAALRRGMLVSICPPALPIVKVMGEQGYLAHGNCAESNVAPLLKTIAALPGDRVRLQHGTPATVNGRPVPNTVAKPSMPAWPDGEYIVKPDQLWVFSSYSMNSFDSRYFGPVNRTTIRGEAAPLLVAGNVEAMQ